MTRLLVVLFRTCRAVVVALAMVACGCPALWAAATGDLPEVYARGEGLHRGPSGHHLQRFGLASPVDCRRRARAGPVLRLFRSDIPAYRPGLPLRVPGKRPGFPTGARRLAPAAHRHDRRHGQDAGSGPLRPVRGAVSTFSPWRSSPGTTPRPIPWKPWPDGAWPWDGAARRRNISGSTERT